jgi:hypothetical protein
MDAIKDTFDYGDTIINIGNQLVELEKHIAELEEVCEKLATLKDNFQTN